MCVGGGVGGALDVLKKKKADVVIKDNEGPFVKGIN